MIELEIRNDLLTKIDRSGGVIGRLYYDVKLLSKLMPGKVSKLKHWKLSNGSSTPRIQLLNEGIDFIVR